MKCSDVTVLRTGSANLASVLAALQRLGCTATVSPGADEARRADYLVVPGVGAIEPVAAAMVESGLDEAVRERVGQDRPTLGICLGLQLLAAASEESGGCDGLGVLPVVVRRFPDTVVVPQLGWNTVEADEHPGLVENGAAYFANSYRISEAPPGWRAAWSDHGGPFVAALERGRVLGCQFHPELSGPWGQDLLQRWLEGSPC